MIRIVLKESRADQLRRELDNTINGTDYGASIDQADSDPTIARAKGLEIDDIEEGPPSFEKRHSERQPEIEDFGYGKSVSYKNSDGDLHRIGLPAYFFIFSNGKIALEEYYKNGQPHNDAGPSLIEYDEHGQIKKQMFYLNGHRLTPEQFKSQRATDPRFSGLDLADNQPPQKTDDTELGNRAKGLEVKPLKKLKQKSASPKPDPRFKALELDEKRKNLKEIFAKLLKRPF